MKTTQKYCEHCEKGFEAKRLDAKFCSGACKQQAYNHRLKTQQNKRVVIEQQEQDVCTAKQIILEKQIAELKKTKETERVRRIDMLGKQMDEMFQKIKVDAIKSNIKNANYILKGWLQKLLDFDRKEETSIYIVKFLFEEIMNPINYAFKDLPLDYKYSPFLNNILIPKATIWYNEIKYTNDRYISIEFP